MDVAAVDSGSMDVDAMDVDAMGVAVVQFADSATTSDSIAMTELRNLSIGLAMRTWQRLCDGYTDKSGQSYNKAKKDEDRGCLLAQKQPNRTVRLRTSGADLFSATLVFSFAMLS